jgi:hypothetical protein
MISAHEAIATDPWDAFLARGLLGAAPLIGNAEIEISAVSVGARKVPLVTNRRGTPDCSWVTSLRNAYGPYARAETDLVRMDRWLQPLYVAGSHLAEALLAAGGLSGGNFLNNWLLATNIYTPDFASKSITSALDEICGGEPGLPVVIRSLTAPLHAELLAALARAGFLLLPSRQVWLVHDPASRAWRHHRDSRRDLSLAESTAEKYEWVPAKDFTDGDYTQARTFFNGSTASAIRSLILTTTKLFSASVSSRVSSSSPVCDRRAAARSAVSSG